MCLIIRTSNYLSMLQPNTKLCTTNNINSLFSEIKDITKKIRLSVLENALSEKISDELQGLALAGYLNENKQDLFLRSVFDENRKLGLKIIDETSSLKPDIIINFFESANIPCLAGNWVPLDDNETFILERKKCPCPVNAFACTFWREAADGLMMGLGDTERYVRHKSIIYGNNSSCVDIIYDSKKTDYKWGDVPKEINKAIAPVIEKLSVIDVKLIVEGFSEKTLFYQIKDKNVSLGSLRYKFIDESVRKFFNKNFSYLELVETSPRAVIQGDF